MSKLFKTHAQTAVNVAYLNPIYDSNSQHKYYRFGNEINFYSGFMWNNNHPSYGNGDDFTIFTYNNRDLVFQAFSGNILMFPNSELGKVGIGTTSDPTAALSIKGRSNNRILDGYNKLII